MRLFKKRTPSPPRLVRLAVLGEGGLASAREGTAGLRFSLPSSLSECNIDELMAYPSSTIGTPRTRRGFPFPWIGRKHGGPKKYAVNPSAFPYMDPDETEPVPDLNSTLLRSAVSQISLDDYSHQWPRSLKTFRKVLPSDNENFIGYVPCDNAFPSTESLNENNNYINNNNVETKKISRSVMYRSVSTSALLEDPKEFYRNVEIDISDVSESKVLEPTTPGCYHLALKTSSCEDLIDHCGGPLDGGSYPKPAASQLGTVLEEEVFLEGLARGSGVFEANHSKSNPAEDTESLASSIQHRSDESGYESDGTKNGNDENVIADRLRENESGQMPQQTAPFKTESNYGGKRLLSPDSPLEKHADTNLQKFASLFQRLTTATPNSARTNTYAVTPRKDEGNNQKQIAKNYEVRSLRLRAPTMLSNLVQRNKDSSITPNRTEKTNVVPKDTNKTPIEDYKKEGRNNSRLGQFKAWTLDRKLLRSRWKKNALPDEKLDIAIPAKRSSIFQSSLFPSSVEDSPSQLQMETKSLTLLSTSNENIYDSNNGDITPSKCGDLNYQLRLKKAGYRSASTANDTRRRLWLQSQLSTSLDNENILASPADLTNKNIVSPSEEKPCRIPSQLDLHEIVPVDLEKDEHGELGIYITGCCDSEKNILGYIIVDFEKGGPAERNGKLLKGDELLIVNGKHLQGVGLEEARQLLRVPEREVHLLVARELPIDLCFKEENSRLSSSLPPVPELHESIIQSESVMPRLRHFHSDVSSTNKPDNRHSHPDFPHKPKVDNERIGSNGICTLPRRPKSSQLSLHTVVFEKGPGRKSLGFSIVGGKDSPKGELGFYVKTIFPSGQAAETGCLKEGDEIYTLNGQSVQGLSHSEAIAAFKKIKQGSVVLHIGRRSTKKCSPLNKSCRKFENNNNVSKSCSTLDNLA